MIVRQVDIENFRGIKELSWKPASSLVCLIGPGNSRKSTILEAIGLALTPRYDPNFNDADFYQMNVDRPIRVEVTVGQLPEDLRKESKFGMYLRGWKEGAGIVDEPDDLYEPVLTVRLTVDASLEPEWLVWNERDSKPISNRDRDRAGVVQIGTNTMWHLSWSRRSALTQTTESTDEASRHLTEALRTVRKGIGETEIEALLEKAGEVERLAKELGVKAEQGFRPGLSPDSISFRGGAFSLHDGLVPLMSSGNGTKRLIAMAVEHLAVPDGAILLLDEVELGLEPHRIRHLLSELKQRVGHGQVLLTSHSPAAISELTTENLAVIQCDAQGQIVASNIPKSLQGTVRASAEALLSPSVIVCEGKTEVGLCRAWDEVVWRKVDKHPPLAQAGVFPIDGGGSHAPKRSIHLARLGYRVAIFMDSDESHVDDNREELESVGVEIFEWTGEMNTETRICQDAPLDLLQDIVDAGGSKLQAGERAVCKSVKDNLRGMSINISEVQGEVALDCDMWLGRGIPEVALRNAVAKSATDGEWFKRIDRGEELGNLIASYASSLSGTDTWRVVDGLGGWAHV